MNNFAYKSNVINDLMYNTLTIEFPDGGENTIDETNIVSESMSLKQSICDGELRFGGCIASEFRISLMNTESRQFSGSLEGKWIVVKIVQTFPGDDLYPSTELEPSQELYPGGMISQYTRTVFVGFIDSAKVDKSDSNIRNIIAFDILAKAFNTDASGLLFNHWSNLARVGSVEEIMYTCLNEMHIVYRNTLLTSFATQEEREYRHINFDWLSGKEKISVGQLLQMCCEFLGVFGYIRPGLTTNDQGNVRGRFDVIVLSAISGSCDEDYTFYEELFVEEFKNVPYTHIIYKNADCGKTDNNGNVIDGRRTLTYVIPGVSGTRRDYDAADNILCDSNDQDFSNLLEGTNIKSRIAVNGKYSVLSATLDGRLWVELGDIICIFRQKTNLDGSFATGVETIYTYVLSRTLTGIQALTDHIESGGTLCI